MTKILDELYGIPRLPDNIDKWEKNTKPVSLSLLDAKLATDLNNAKELADNKLFRAAEKSKTYLWVMDLNGEILIAIEEISIDQPNAPYSGYPRRRGYRHPSEQKKLGHPTLVNGDKARIAGELALDDDDISQKLKWIINANSGRYCKQLPPDKFQLDNVAKLFNSFGLDVEVDYD